jgi:hypothetical protein
MRIAWKAPVGIAVTIAAVLLWTTRPSRLADVLFVIVGSMLLGAAIAAVGSWPSRHRDSQRY